MAQAMNPMGARQAEPTRTVSAEGQAPTTATPMQRPAMVTFAAFMLFVMGGFSVVWAIVEFSQAQWLRNVYSAYGFSNLGNATWVWGFLDLIIAAIAIYAGVIVLRGSGPFAQIIGLSLVGFSAVRWFFFLPVAPWLSITLIALDVLVAYGLIAHTEYFGDVKFP